MACILVLLWSKTVKLNTLGQCDATFMRSLVCPGEVSSASGCAVSAGGSVIFGSNAVCRYFSYKSVPSLQKGVAAGLTGAVEEWLHWEAVTLAPAERLLAESKAAGGSLPTETLEAMTHLEEKLTGTWLLEGVSQHHVDNLLP